MRLCQGKWGGPHDLDVVGVDKSGRCRACNKARCKAYYEANREQVKARHKAYSKAWREANADKKKAYDKAYRQRPEVKERRLEAFQRWYDDGGWVTQMRGRLESRKIALGS